MEGIGLLLVLGCEDSLEIEVVWRGVKFGLGFCDFFCFCSLVGCLVKSRFSSVYGMIDRWRKSGEKWCFYW